LGSFPTRLAYLTRTAAAPRWSAPAIVGLGLLTALLEGAGLYLFIPLLGSLGTAGAESGIATVFERLLAPVPTEWRIPLLVAAICATIALKNGVVQLNHYVTQYVNGEVAHRLRTQLMRQTVESCVDYRQESRRTDTVNTISTHTWSVATALLQAHRVFVCACMIVVFTVLLLVLSPLLTALALGLFGVTALVVNHATRHAQRIGEEVVEQNKAFGLRMWECIVGLRLIRSCAREEYELSRFEAASEELRRRLLRVSVLWAIPTPVSEVAIAFGIGGLILTGHWLGVGLPSLAAFLALLYRMRGPVRELMASRIALDSNFAAVQDVAEFQQRTREPYLRSGPVRFDRLEHGLELRDVSFHYAPGEPAALAGASLLIPRGKTTAIVGRSGAGKSTLMDLLFRFRDPTGGEILVDGRPLVQLELGSWRARLAIMSQEVHLFNDTVEANIGYGRAGASEADIREAARMAGAHDFICELPNGYATSLGDGGIRLSGGQRQRIALARTVLRDPEILLLDEATNALDNETEREFQAALRRFARNRTVVVIAHRLSTIESADQIVVLEQGRVVEAGPPAGLLAANGSYARLQALQAAQPLPAA
jgi:subfamily B ATP-binding cassette protein MsbA